MRFSVYLSQEDKSYIPFLKDLLGPHIPTYHYIQPNTLSEALLGTDAILTTTNNLLKLLTQKKKCTHEDYIGSFWIRKDPTGRKEIPVLCLPPLKRLVSTKPGTFLFKRFISKITKPQNWPAPQPFKWSLSDDLLGYRDAYHSLVSADLISVDIETNPAYEDRENERNPHHIISCVSYTGCTFRSDGNVFDLSTFVIPCSSLEAFAWIKKINQLPQPKIFQNGKYDNFYFLRFGAPVRNWLFDTLEMHHCLFAELPKDLAYQAAFYIREISYWKDEGSTGDLQDLYRYNGQDSWATMLVMLEQLKNCPDWGVRNYLEKFPLVVPCLASELDGLKINLPTRSRLKEEQLVKAEKSLSSLQAKLGIPGFNPRSPKQVLSLMHLLGCKDLASSDEKNREKASDRHPIIRLLLDEVTYYRESTKLISTYLDAELWRGKLLYTLNPSGTDTARLASRESALWCGAQLQNLPPYFKQCIEAEEGFLLGEGDFKQSETFCTAYLSGDPTLLAAVNDSARDFHAANAEKFFGLPYEEILEEERIANEQPSKPFTIRDLSKRVNHGSNYNMGPAVLLATMGAKNVLRAKVLLGLPGKLTPLAVCQLLLARFDATYPVLKGDFYDYVKATVQTKRMLTSQLGWTRLCFGKPWASKPDLNGYIAHCPSNLSVGIINRAFRRAFWDIQLANPEDFRLKGQIHDSILFGYREGRTDLVQKVKEIMTIPTPVKDCKGIERIMTIPVDMKGEHKVWASLKKLKGL